TGRLVVQFAALYRARGAAKTGGGPSFSGNRGKHPETALNTGACLQLSNPSQWWPLSVRWAAVVGRYGQWEDHVGYSRDAGARRLRRQRRQPSFQPDQRWPSGL